MSIQDWGAVGEILGAIAVVVTLIYLAAQIRQNTRSSRSATRQALADGAQRLASDVVELDDMARIFQDHVDGKELKPHELLRLQARCLRDLRWWDNAHYQYSEGLLTEDEWDGFRENLKLLFQLPAYRDYWADFQVMFSAHFRRELNSLLSDEQPFDFRNALSKGEETNALSKGEETTED